MKKFVKFFAIFLAALLVLGCPQNPESGKSSPSDDDVKTLTQKINIDSNDIDFGNVTITEDAEVNTAKKISNLNMGGKTLTVNVSGVTLVNVSNVKIIAAKGIGEGDFTIDNCKITDLKILGGGSNSIHVKNTNIEKVSVEKENVRLHLEDSTEIADVKVAVNNIKIEAEAGKKETPKIAALTIEASDKNKETSNIQIKNAVIDTVAVEKENVILSLAEDTKIAEVNISADNTSIQATSEDTTKAPVIENVKVDEKVETVEIGGGKIENLEVKITDTTESAPKIKITAPVEITEVKQLDKENKEVETKEITIIVPEEISEQIKLPEEVKTETITLINSEIVIDGIKRSYKTGEEFDITGAYAVYTYSDKSVTKTPLTNENATVEGFTTDTDKDTCDVTITYKDLTKTFSVKLNSDLSKINLSDMDIATVFNLTTGGAKDDYDTIIDITEKFNGILPEVGEKVQVSYKFTLSDDVDNLTAMLYTDDNGDWTYLDSSAKKLVASDIKAGTEVSGTLLFNFDVQRAKSIYIQFFCKHDKTFFMENGKGYPSETEHFIAQPCDDGIVIGLINFDSDYNNITVTNITSGISTGCRSNISALVIPFIEKDVPNYLEVSYNFTDYKIIKVTPTAGRDINDYVDFTKFNNSKLTTYYDSALDEFYASLDTEIKTLNDVFKKPEEITNACLSISAYVGNKEWTNTEYKAGTNVYFADNVYISKDGYFVDAEKYADNEEYADCEPYTGLYCNNKSYIGYTLIRDKNVFIPFLWGNNATEEDWKKYNNNFWSQLEISFSLPFYDSFYGTTFSITKGIQSPISYNPAGVDSTKNLDLEAELKNGIANVKEYISSEEELVSALMEAGMYVAQIFDNDDDYAVPVQELTLGNKRSLSKTPAAKNAYDAKDQVMKFLTSGIDAYAQIMKDIKEEKLKLTFDETLNYDELTLEQWFTIFGGIYNEVVTQIYGGVDISIPKEEKYWVNDRTEYSKTKLSDKEFFEIYPQGIPWYYDETGTYIVWHTKYYTEEEWNEYCKYPCTSYWNPDLGQSVWVWKGKEYTEPSDMFTEMNDRFGYNWDIDYNPVFGEPYVSIEIKNIIPGHYETKTKYQYIDSFETLMKDAERDSGIQFMTLFSILDKYISIKDLYLNLFADVDFDMANFKNEAFNLGTTAGTVGLDGNLYFGLVNFNDMIDELAEWSGDEYPYGTSPINALTLKLENATSVSATYSDVFGFLTEDLSENFLSGSFLDNSLELKSAICTSEGLGGIVTINLDTKADIGEFVTLFMNSIQIKQYEEGESNGSGVEVYGDDPFEYGELTDTVISKEDEEGFFKFDPTVLLNLIDSLTITVSDGTKNTLELNYTIEDIMAIIASFIQ